MNSIENILNPLPWAGVGLVTGAKLETGADRGLREDGGSVVQFWRRDVVFHLQMIFQ